MTDHLFFGPDTTELRVQNELNQRNFIKAIPQHLAPQIEDDYDVLQGFRLKVTTIHPVDYLVWLLSTEWHACSLKLQDMANDMPDVVRKYIEQSMKQYPSAWGDERIKAILSKLSR
jgi:hypothetical protein